MNDEREGPVADDLRTLADQEAFVDDALQRSEGFRRDKQHEKGIALLIEALKYGIRKDDIYYRLGNLYIDGGDLSRAEYAYGRAIEVNPKHVNATHNLAVVYKRQKKISEYVKTYKKSQKLAMRYPKNPNLTAEQKTHYRRLAGRSFVWIVGGLAVIGLLVYLFLR